MVASPVATPDGDEAGVPIREITCEDFIRTLADYLAGELARDAREQSDVHLAVCPDCVRYLKDYEVTIRLGREASREDGKDGEPPLPDGLAEVILSARKKT